MQTVQLQIDDKYFDSFLALINNLKEGMVKGVKIDTETLLATDKQHEINKNYFQNALHEVEKDATKIVSHEDAWQEISTHIEANT